jgi:hypothetical protein
MYPSLTPVYYLSVNEKQHHESEAEYYLHYTGSVYCTELEFGTFYMRSF